MWCKRCIFERGKVYKVIVSLRKVLECTNTIEARFCREDKTRTLCKFIWHEYVMLNQALEIMQLRFHAYIFFIENWTHHLNVFVFTAHYVINSQHIITKRMLWLFVRKGAIFDLWCAHFLCSQAMVTNSPTYTLRNGFHYGWPFVEFESFLNLQFIRFV